MNLHTHNNNSTTTTTTTVGRWRSSLLAWTALMMMVVAVSAGTNEAGLAFLEENKQKPGVITLPSGLQYKVLKKGKGPAHPTIDSDCSCHYEGKLIDGTVFDSSYERGEPTTFAPNQVIKGWTEAMQLMVA
jgi:FKBP-type peptidyl-prolyl cis-trans isomerase FklB